MPFFLIIIKTSRVFHRVSGREKRPGLDTCWPENGSLLVGVEDCEKWIYRSPETLCARRKLRYCGFDSAVYGNLDAKWLFRKKMNLAGSSNDNV